MKKFLKNLFVPSKKGNQDSSEFQVEQTNNFDEQNIFQKPCLISKIMNKNVKDDEMDKFSKKHKERGFKMSVQASNNLQQSILAKNRIMKYEHNQQNKKNESFNEGNFIHENDNDDEEIKNFLYVKHETQQEDKFENNEMNVEQNHNQIGNLKHLSPYLNETLNNEKELKYNSALNRKLNDFTVSKKVTFGDEQMISKIIMPTSDGAVSKIQKQNTASTNKFINESEIQKNQISKMDTLCIQKQETIQNNYLESVFISEEEEEEEEEEEDEGDDENSEEDEGMMDTSQEKQDHHIYLKKPDNIEKMQIEEQKISQQGLNLLKYNQNIQESYFLDEKKQQFGQNQTLEVEKQKEEQEGNKKPKKKLYQKRKRHELLSVPDETSSFQITFQRGKKKYLNSGLAQSVSVLNVPKKINNEQSQLIQSLYKDSKSNLNNLILEQNKYNMFSLIQNCSDVYSFSKMTTLISQFQYKKQETLIHHQLEDFRFITNIGKGSFGKVDLYEFVPLNFPIAVKTIKNLEEFARELYLMESLESTYMPQLFYYDETEMKLFMELGLCSLEDYRQYSLQTQQYINDDQAFAILSQIILAIEIFIDQKAFHSDIKPQNIVIRSKIDKNQQINLELMIIDYGGASYDIEDYWIYYTPAFVCLPLWEKILDSGQVANSQQKSNSQETNSVNQDKQNQEKDFFFNNQNNNNTNYKYLSQQLQNLSISKVQSNFINPIYQNSQKKKNNLKDLDLQAAKNSQLGVNLILGSEISNSTSSSITSNRKQIIESYSVTENTQVSNILCTSYPLKEKQVNQIDKNRVINAENNNYRELSQNLNNTDEINNNDFKFYEPLNLNNKQIKIINPSQQQVNEQFINKPSIEETDFKNKLEKLEYLRLIQQQLESMQNEWTKTLNLHYDKNNEMNAHDQWLTWEEIRYSEVYAGCRCVQFLILRKEDTEELFKKKNIEQFIINYHKLYPKTMKLMYKIYSKINSYSITKDQLNQLFSKTTEKDYQINLDPKVIFNISPLQKSLNKINAQSN